MAREKHLVRIAWGPTLDLKVWLLSPLVVVCESEDEARKAICAAAALGAVTSITVEKTEIIPFAKWIKQVRAGDPR